MKVSVCSLGCKVNQYESDCMAKILSDRGYDVCEGLIAADCYIVNTCAVTHEAERKSRQMLSRIKKINPSAIIVVTGCASQKNPEPFIKDENVKSVSGCAQKYSLEFFPDINIIKDKYEQKISSDEFSDKNISSNKILNGKISGSSISNNFNLVGSGKFLKKELPLLFEDCDGPLCFRERSFVKIQDGCDNFCSYCIIPYLRGRSRSRNEDSIVKECLRLSKISKEIVLTAINLSAYGKDNGSSLVSLIKKLSEINCRFRLGSLEAGFLNEETLSAMKKAGFCPHFHLSLQSGDKDVLKSMNRKYSPQIFSEKLKLIRMYFEKPCITTDIIVGFPTESEEAFQNTVDFVKKAEFSDIHIFPYSAREGTASYNLKSLPPNVLKERVEKMALVKKELYNKYRSQFIGKVLHVLIEQKRGGYYFGYSENYIYVKVKNPNLKIGEIYKIKIVRDADGVSEGVVYE